MNFLKKWLFKPKVKPVVYEYAAHQFDESGVEKNAIKVLKQLEKCGYDAYLVGGVIRDLLLKIPSKDCDVATNAKPEQIVKRIKKSIIVGRRFKIVHARFGRQIIEVSTFRSSASSKKRNISSQGIIKRDNIYGRIDEDALRRDFTVNALYYRHADKAILDFVGGMQDLADKRLRSIGDPMERFPEDPVRMLRAVRFSAKLALNIDDNIIEAIAKNKHLLNEISGQRLYVELIKLYYSGHAEASTKLLYKLGIMDILLPEYSKLQRVEETRRLLEVMSKSADVRYKASKRLSIVYLLACLYWPVFAARMAKKNLRHFSKQVAEEVLSKARFDIPLKTRDDVYEIWYNQYQFRLKEKSLKKVMKSSRLRASCELLCQRAMVDMRLDDMALFWSEHINE